MSCVTPNTVTHLATLKLLMKKTHLFLLAHHHHQFPSLHLSWAHYYWVLTQGFLETSSQYLAPRHLIRKTWDTTGSWTCCLMLLIIFVVRPRKAVSPEIPCCEWSHSDAQGVSHMWSQDCLPCKRGSCCGSCCKNSSSGSVLTKAKRSFWFLLRGSYAHLSQIQN